MDKQNYIYKEFLKVSEECTGILREFNTDWITIESQYDYKTLSESQIKDGFWSDTFLIEDYYNDCWGNKKFTVNHYYDERLLLFFDAPVKEVLKELGFSDKNVERYTSDLAKYIYIKSKTYHITTRPDYYGAYKVYLAKAISKMELKKLLKDFFIYRKVEDFM